MELIKKLFSSASDAEFKLAQDLVAIAMADGEISEEERKMIADICLREGLSIDAMQEATESMDSAQNSPLSNHREKIEYLRKLIQVMGVDGECAPLEIYLLELVASKMDIGYMDLLSLVLTTATRKYFKGDVGGRALASFIRNAVDPKGKSLACNRENISKLFDIIAMNVSQHQNADDGKTEFVKAMNAATNMLKENSLLCNEFRGIGIDFETVLMTEREQAISRWMQR